MWNFVNCIGAIDGKHIVIQAPAHSGSTFYNYQASHSIVLLAICDANYSFTLVDIGAEGRQSDEGIFQRSDIGIAFENNLLNVPPPENISENCILPFVLVGDEAFALKTYMMRPFSRKSLTYERRIFNYRLSQARHIIESAFGILASRWRIFRKPIIASLKTVDNIIKASICLHNFLIKNELRRPVNERRYMFDRMEYNEHGAVRNIA
ncbi:hypothetical protein DMN91_000925 [Ooceraea biroi]|uniref:DDE Tnp4 domain-containing protein n=2 Tax=Ooceraea biroi TaxID=2015173 RepID=A0A3L8E3A0_OOCBI|nr:hypothetical protein DMN91_000925 [Ooceraea biroi]